MFNASIIVATYNRANSLNKVLEAMQNQDFSGTYEIIVVDDGSIDNTPTVASRYPVRFLSQEHKGPAAARNLGIKKSQYPIIVVMDDDCLPEQQWLSNLLDGFKGDNIGIVSSFSYFGGTSTAYLKKAITSVGYFDEKFPFEYREDTDLVFRIQDKGYKVKVVQNAKFIHLHQSPKNLEGKLRYILERLWVHRIDPFLFKKHPKRTKDFLDIKAGFIRNPIKDFQVATGTWIKGERLKLSSPQGVVLIENKTLIHSILIILGGILYTFAVKLVRLYGSFRYRKLLI
tara:strand:- start:387 stop:1244 length:858 start_codon:yes stop_codon:yes gene_type:complete